jgi:hypothetical protein
MRRANDPNFKERECSCVAHHTCSEFVLVVIKRFRTAQVVQQGSLRKVCIAICNLVRHCSVPRKHPKVADVVPANAYWQSWCYTLPPLYSRR